MTFHVVYALGILLILLGQLCLWGLALMMRGVADRLRNLDRVPITPDEGRSMRLLALLLCLLGAGLCVAGRDFGMFGNGLFVNGVAFVISSAVLLNASFAATKPAGSAASGKGMAQTIGALSYVVFFAPAVFSLASAWFLMFIPVVLILVMFEAAIRRTSQRTALWALAFGAETGSSLTNELVRIAPDLSRGQRGHALRLAWLLSDGVPLEQALPMVPGVIPHGAMLEIQVGAQNGRLIGALKTAALRYAGNVERHRVGAGSSTLVFVYIAAVPLVATLILFGIMKWIIPKFKAIFLGFGSELPTATQKLIEVSDSVATWGPVLIVLIGIGVSYLEYLYCRGWGENDFPLFGSWFRRLDTPGILRNLAATVAADQPLEQTVQLLGKSHRRSAVRSALRHVEQSCAQGADIWTALGNNGLLKSAEVAVLSSAARVGNLWWALNQVAETIERRQSFRVKGYLELLQPVLVMGLGMVVGWICISLFIPLIRLLNDLA